MDELKSRPRKGKVVSFMKFGDIVRESSTFKRKLLIKCLFTLCDSQSK